MCLHQIYAAHATTVSIRCDDAYAVPAYLREDTSDLSVGGLRAFVLYWLICCSQLEKARNNSISYLMLNIKKCS